MTVSVRKILLSAAAFLPLAFGAVSAEASVLVTKIIIKNALAPDSNLGYLQIGEIQTLNAQGVDSITAPGTSISASSFYGNNPIYAPSQAIDGNTSTFFHSGSYGSGEYFEIDFSNPVSLASLVINGRAGFGARDVYDIAFFDGGALPFQTSTLNNSALDGAAGRVALPEPATWAMMFMGFGLIGFGLRYRRRRTALAYA